MAKFKTSREAGEPGDLHQAHPILRKLRAIRNFVRSSLSRQFVAAVMLVNVAIMGLIGRDLSDRERMLLDKQSLDRAAAVTQVLAAGAAAPLARGDVSELRRLARASVSTGSIDYILVENAAGRIIVRQGNPSRIRDVGEIDRGTLLNRSDVRLLSRGGGPYLVGAPVRVNGGVEGWVAVGVSAVATHRDLLFFWLLYGSAIVLLGGLTAFLTARSVTERLAKLATVADRVRQGDRSVRAPNTGFDEVSAVARGLNAMLDNIAASERALHDVFRIAQIGSWRYVPSEAQLQWSDTTRELFGLAPLENPPAVQAFLQNLAPHHRANLRNLLKSDKPEQTYSFSFTLNRAEGTPRVFWVEARSEVARETGERCLVGVCQDITERETAAAQLRQAQKMEAVGQLTGGLAHDFNNLLAIVIGNLDLLKEDLAEGAGAHECVDEALTAALRGADLTRQLLAFSRRQSLSPQKVDLNKSIAGMASLWRRTLGKSIEVRIDLAEDLWPTSVDPTLVETAVLNLVINARDAMSEGGTLSVETGNVTIDEEWSDGSEEGDRIRAGDYSVITVSDDGKGMAPETIARAFEPFFTTKAVGEGSGLGLSMIYGFAKQSGGTVKIYSELAKGTAVRLYLPRAETKAGASHERKPVVPPLASNETVLLVEDDESVRRVAARQLGELGYTVLAAANGQEALGILDRNPDVDVLFTDIVMPGSMSGFELGKVASSRHPRLKILHTSGFTRPSSSDAGDPSGSLVLLTKPYRKIDLAVKLREVLGAPNASGGSQGSKLH